MIKIRWSLSVILLIAVAFLCHGCGTQSPQSVPKSSPLPPTTSAKAFDAAEVTKQAIWEAYGKVLGEVESGIFPADAVTAKKMMQGSENDYYIIDLRAPEDYAKKHVKGAVNLGIVKFAESIEKLPSDKTLVLYCYTGQSSALAMAPLKVYGYRAIFINGGFSSLVQAGFDMDTRSTPFVPTDRNAPNDLQAAAVLAGVKANLVAIAKQHSVKTLVISQADTKELVEGLPTKYAFVDLRPKEDYDRGHIKNSISAPLAELRSKVPALPKEKRLILCCKSGQLAAMTTAPLTAEGFKIISLCAGFSQLEEKNFPMEKKL
ncbi:MAG TPA: rhodanese-like domain-containing protein [Negativicutes bacterium]|nr:rhodanese-like domain-containing protein [Negativicutes bacterium]